MSTPFHCDIENGLGHAVPKVAIKLYLQYVDDTGERVQRITVKLQVSSGMVANAEDVLVNWRRVVSDGIGDEQALLSG